VNFWCIFEPHFFRVYYFSSKQEACQEVLLEQEVNEIMSGCHPSYLKTVSEQVVSRIRTHSLRFLTPNTAILVGIIQIYTNFGCLKWLVKMVKSPKIFVSGFILRFQQPSTSNEEAQRSFECDVCGKLFPNKPKTRRHVQYHVKLAIFECDFCGKSSKFKDKLRYNILVWHSDVKPFECLICGSKFKLSIQLKRHLKDHFDRRDFKCTICGKSYKRNGDLKDHLRSHENKREFECKICGKSFNTKESLKHHRVVHRPKNFKCPECGKSFLNQILISQGIQ
jgi:uncharacterized Zn-finger protein